MTGYSITQKTTTMKKIFFAFVAALLCTSCLVNEKETPVLNGAYEKFYAVIEDGLSKVYADNELNVRWNADDRISVFNKTTGNQPFAFQGADGDLSGVFTPAGEPGGGTAMDKVYAVYPYDSQTAIDGSGTITLKLPAHQRYRENSFGSEANTMVSAGGDNNLLFKNLCGYLALKLYGDDVTVSSISLRGNNGERLSGKCAVTCAPGEEPSLVFDPSGTFEISLGFDTPVALGSSAEDATTFWLVVPPVSFSGGFTLTVHDNSGSIFKKSTSEELTISRNTLSRMKALKVEPAPQAVAEAVDLGLSVKWASFNLGATKPEEIGDYYAWGETEPKENYTRDSYKWYNGKMTKYCDDSSSWGGTGTTDMKGVLDEEDDAARLTWGGKWRMPTEAEMYELQEKCTFARTTENGVPGYRITSKKNGNSIFLPASGYKEGQTLKYTENVYCRSSLRSPNNYYAGTMEWRGNIQNVSGLERAIGTVIRPVYGDFVHVTGLTLDKATATLPSEGSSLLLTATLSPSKPTEPCLYWKSSNRSVVSIADAKNQEDGLGAVRAKGPGTAVITAYTPDGNYSASCTITVKEGFPVPEIVDMGLSVKWSSCNLGAENPEEFGGHWAWGEAEQQYSYSYSNYIYHPAEDAARAQLGDLWRVPMENEFAELWDNCTHDWTTLNGVFGCRLTSKKNGNSLFLPAAGFWGWYNSAFDDLNYAGEEGWYWTLSESANYGEYYGRCLNFKPYDYPVSPHATGSYKDFDKYYGLSIRPVYGAIEAEYVAFDKEEILLTANNRTELSLKVYPPAADIDLSAEKLWVSVFDSWMLVSFEDFVGDNEDGLLISKKEDGTRLCVYSGGEPGAYTLTLHIGDTPDQPKFEASCFIEVINEMPDPEPVDLGLSVKWASFNLGARVPEDSGGYFAWGENNSRGIWYRSWYDYLWSDGWETVKKYNNYNYSYNYGPVDGKTVLEPEDDAASVLLGGSWRMPTAEEFDELFSHCYSQWTYLNGVGGYLLESRINYNEIFLPAAGFSGFDKEDEYQEYGYEYRWDLGAYWSSSLYDDYPLVAKSLMFTRQEYYYFECVSWRSNGLPIRPVCP